MFLNIVSAKPSFLARRYITSLSSLDSKIGLTICSPHWMGCVECWRERAVSYLVAIGKRYVLFLRSGASAAQVVGCGSATTSSSSFSMPFCACGMRVTVLPPWPNTIIALMLSFWDTSFLSHSVASNQRVDGMPGVFMVLVSLPSGPVILSNRPTNQSYGTSQTRDQC